MSLNRSLQWLVVMILLVMVALGGLAQAQEPDPLSDNLSTVKRAAELQTRS